MTEANRYSYKYYLEWIFPRFISHSKQELTALLISLQQEFEKGLTQNKLSLNRTMGSAYIGKLEHIILPKLIRQQAHNIDNYKSDLWHVFMIATWSSWHLDKITQSSSGIWHWKTDWDDQPYGNSNAYLNSDDTVQNEVYTNQPSYDRTVDLQRSTYTSDKLGTDIDI